MVDAVVVDVNDEVDGVDVVDAEKLVIDVDEDGAEFVDVGEGDDFGAEGEVDGVSVDVVDDE